MSFFTRVLFNLWYFGRPPWDTGISPPELIEFIKRHPPGRALDIGCGSGTNAISLAKNGWQTIGIDYVPRAITFARKKSRLEGVNVDFFVADITKDLDIADPFDLILDVGCFHSLSLPAKDAYIHNLKRLLVPGGIFLLYIFFKSGTSKYSSGIFESELGLISKEFTLIHREDGFERGRRPSAWLTFTL